MLNTDDVHVSLLFFDVYTNGGTYGSTDAVCALIFCHTFCSKHFVFRAIRGIMNKMAKGDEHVEYRDKCFLEFI